MWRINMCKGKYVEDKAKCGGGGVYYSGIKKMERINWKVYLNNYIVQGEKNTFTYWVFNCLFVFCI